MKILGMIPARMGSQRVKKKNIRLLNGRPMIEYAINAAKNSKLLTRSYLNSESKLLGSIAKKNGIEFYQRESTLATDDAKQEDFNYDFIKNTGADVLVMINPVSPLITSDDVDAVIQFYLDNEFDTVITTEDLKQQAFYDNEPINIDKYQILQPTQSLSPIQLCAWSITVWKAEVFVKLFESEHYGAFGGRLGFFPMSRQKCLKISYEEDFQLADFILRSKEEELQSPEYYAE